MHGRCVCVPLCVYILCIYMYIYVYMYICIYVYVYIYYHIYRYILLLNILYYNILYYIKLYHACLVVWPRDPGVPGNSWFRKVGQKELHTVYFFMVSVRFLLSDHRSLEFQTEQFPNAFSIARRQILTACASTSCDCCIHAIRGRQRTKGCACSA